jgi:uncharacterized protein YjbI with pentapeptide repeats
MNEERPQRNRTRGICQRCGKLIWDLVSALILKLISVFIFLYQMFAVAPVWIRRQLLSSDDINGYESPQRKDAIELLKIYISGAGLLSALAVFAGLIMNNNNSIQERNLSELSKSIERLSSDKIFIRVGGIKSLETIAINSSEERDKTATILHSFIGRRNLEIFSISKDIALQKIHLSSLDVCSRVEDYNKYDNKNNNENLDVQNSEADIQMAVLAIARIVDLGGKANFSMSCIDFSHMQLSGMRFNNANFYKSIFYNSNLNDTQLREANFSFTNIRHTGFKKSRLEKAKFSNATANQADFTGANLTEASFTGTKLSDAYFTGANLTRADFTGANLTGADFAGANITGAIFVNAINANLEKAIK